MLLGSFVEPVGHAGEHLELEVRNGLECDLKRQRRCRAVDLNIMLAEMPELVREDDGFVVALARRVSYMWIKGDV